MPLTQKRAQELLEVLDQAQNGIFKDRRKCTYPYTEWEHKRSQVKQRLQRLPQYVHDAVKAINREEEKQGRPPKLDLEKKVNLFLFARLLCKSNRDMEEALELFSLFSGLTSATSTSNASTATKKSKLALHNLFVLLLKDEGTTGEFSGDGTGYSVKVDSHYATDPKKYGKKYVHFFSMIDLGTGMYVGCGTSKDSEWDAFLKAMHMLRPKSRWRQNPSHRRDARHVRRLSSRRARMDRSPRRAHDAHDPAARTGTRSDGAELRDACGTGVSHRTRAPQRSAQRQPGHARSASACHLRRPPRAMRNRPPRSPPWRDRRGWRISPQVRRTAPLRRQR